MMGLTGSGVGIAISALFLVSSCTRNHQPIEPHISYSVQDRYLKQLPPPFPPLVLSEKETDWGREYRIGIGLAKKLDFYRAITAFRRAEILLPENEITRRQELEYEILLCYYLGKRYEELDQAFSTSSLAKVGSDFPAYHDLLVILYETYLQLGYEERACQILQIIAQQNPTTYNNLIISSAMQKGNFPLMEQIVACPPKRPYLEELLTSYECDQKSPTKAALFNAVLPGTGYLYLGQIQTGITAMLFNGLFIASTVYFFLDGPIAAGIITLSFEMGWYIGGIQGAANQARFYNARLWEQKATPIMNREKLFPIFQLNYAF